MSLKLLPYEVLKGNELDPVSDGIDFLCPESGLDLCIYKRGHESLQQLSLEESNYLVLEATVLEEYSMCFQINFYRGTPQEEQEADFRMIFGILPGIRLTVPLDLEILNSQDIFPSRTLGRLKMTVFGKPIRKEEIQEIHLTTMPYVKEHRIRIYQLNFTQTEPEVVLSDIKLMDELGQWIPKEWHTKLPNRNACNTFLNTIHQKATSFQGHYPYSDWDSYGGWVKKPMSKTGWFHTEFDGVRWWLVDPEGNAFLSTGIDCIVPGIETRFDILQPWCSFLPEEDGTYKDAHENGKRYDMDIELFNYGVANMIAAFPEDNWWDCWAKIIKMYLCEWGINTIGNWSDIRFIRYAKMPYVLPLDRYSAKGYPSTKVKIFRDFPDVFSEEYSDASKEYAKALEQFAEDPYLIGYFMRNEPAWAFVYELNIAEEMLANPSSTASKKVFVDRMRDKYIEVSVFNRAWNLAIDTFEELHQPIYHACSLSVQAKQDLAEFSKEMITLYVELPAKACRKVDHNHLNLGMRYAYITDISLLSGYENFDVFSINSYQFSPYEEVESIGSQLNMPVMIGEFHQGALDMGLTAHGIKGVKDQTERAKAYRYYVEQGSLSKYFLGAHYFQLNDQSCLGRFDGENYQIGLIDVCMQEYKEMADAMRQCHCQIYQIASGNLPAFDTLPVHVPPIHY
jgi:hypothetical protein